MANKSKFGLGLILGIVGGALAGLFLAPNSGKKNREEFMKKMRELKETIDKGEVKEKVMEIFGDATDASMRLYNKTSDEIMRRLDLLKDSARDIDRDKYVKIVNEAVDEVKKERQLPTEKLSKLKDYFIADWNKVMKDQGKKTEK